MTTPSPTPRPMRNPGSPRGEPLVWMSAMGLTLGLTMVLGLLLVIFSEGLASFWPRHVEQFTLVEGSRGQIAGSRVIAGEILVDRAKRLVGSEEPQRELQVFVGNRDIYKLGFQWLDVNEIESRSRPEDLILIERMEYGDAIGTAVKLIQADGTEVAFGTAAFETELVRLTELAEERRDEILAIEKSQIGSINRTMDELAIRKRSLEQPADPKVVASIDAKLAEQQGLYETLAAKSKELRQRQKLEKLVYTLPTGGENTIEVGNIIGHYYPNQLGPFARFKRFISNGVAFVWENPREANTEGGIFPAIFGTFIMTILMSAAVVPFGVVAAIYLREYARQGPVVRAVRIAVNNLAGVPSIVFGVFGLGFFVYVVGANMDEWLFSDRLPTPTFGTGGIMWASLTLALMTVPVVIVATEEAISAVPRGAKEGSLAMGASKWQTIQRIVLPASAPGILTGLILAMARGAGEVAPLMLVGVVKLAPSLPVDGIWKSTDIIPMVHLDQKFMHLGFHIYDLGFQSPDSDAAKPMVFATTLFLILLVVGLNITAILLRERLRRKYKASTF